MRRAAKVDANQAEIVKALRGAGAEVLSLAAMGDGVPDLLVCWRGALYLLEVKDGKRPPSARKLTDDQKKFHQRWPVSVVTNQQQALALLVGIRFMAVDQLRDAAKATIAECYRHGKFHTEE